MTRAATRRPITTIILPDGRAYMYRGDPSGEGNQRSLRTTGACIICGERTGMIGTSLEGRVHQYGPLRHKYRDGGGRWRKGSVREWREINQTVAAREALQGGSAS